MAGVIGIISTLSNIGDGALIRKVNGIKYSRKKHKLKFLAGF